MTGQVRLVIDGHPVVVAADITLATALLSLHVAAFRRSPTGESRAPLCGMGICFDCEVTVDGRSHVRSCITAVRDGMDVSTEGAR